MLVPRKVKYRKQHRGRRAGLAYRGSTVSFGDYGLKAMEACWLTSRQIEASRVAISRIVRKHGKMWIRIFPDKPVSKNLPKPVRVKVKVDRNFGLRLLSRVVSSLK